MFRKRRVGIERKALLEGRRRLGELSLRLEGRASFAQLERARMPFDFGVKLFVRKRGKIRPDFRSRWFGVAGYGFPRIPKHERGCLRSAARRGAGDETDIPRAVRGERLRETEPSNLHELHERSRCVVGDKKILVVIQREDTSLAVRGDEFRPEGVGRHRLEAASPASPRAGFLPLGAEDADKPGSVFRYDGGGEPSVRQRREGLHARNVERPHERAVACEHEEVRIACDREDASRSRGQREDLRRRDAFFAEGIALEADTPQDLAIG